MPGCIVSATTASFRSVEKRRRRATPVMTSTFENVSDIGVCLGLYLGPPAKAGVRSKRGAVHGLTARAEFAPMDVLTCQAAAAGEPKEVGVAGDQDQGKQASCERKLARKRIRRSEP